jgi:hypothetical protein
MRSQRHLAAPPEALDDDPPISSVMTPHVVAITPDSPLATGLRLMASSNVRHLPVIEGSRLGLVLETDIVRAVATGGPLIGPLVRPVPMVPMGGRRSLAARAVLAGDVDAVVVTGSGWSASSPRPTWCAHWRPVCTRNRPCRDLSRRPDRRSADPDQRSCSIVADRALLRPYWRPSSRCRHRDRVSPETRLDQRDGHVLLCAA